MDCMVERHGELAIISICGDLEATTVDCFQTSVARLLGAGVRYYVIDLAELGTLDSAGLAALIGLYKRVHLGTGDVRLARVPPPVQRLFDLTRLSRVFEIFPTVAEAVASLETLD
jgi:anti-sigma B factor antagonist